jgi:F-type H+-transporting ATPase subunit b
MPKPKLAAASTDSEQDKAIAELRARVTALAIERAEAQLKDLLTASAQTELVDRSIAMVGGK